MLHIQLFDRDFFSSNDYICEYEIDLTDIADLVRLSNRGITISRSLKEEICGEGNELQYIEGDESYDNRLRKIFDERYNGGIKFEFNNKKDKRDPAPDCFWISKTFENKGTDKDTKPEVNIRVRLDLRVVN